MDNFFNKEFYINLAVIITLTIAAIVSNFNFDLTVIMGVGWAFFTVIHLVKLYASIHEDEFSIDNIPHSDARGK